MKTFTQFIDEGKKKGLWDNIHAKRKRGESPAKKGDPDYPKTLNVEAKIAASPNPGPAPVKPGDVPVAPSSPWLPGKSPAKLAKKLREAKTAAWQRKEGKNKKGGLNEKGRKSYERENPGSDLKAPQPKGGPRKRSFCARMGGVKGPMKKPNGEPTRKALALRKWKC